MTSDTSDTTDTSACLARDHEAPVLAAALVVRLRAEGRDELAGAITTLVSEVVAADLIGGPPNPHTQTAEADADAVDPNPPNPH
jgi:hypothetical protein